MTKKRILFVDDEPNILSGLRRMLRSMRKQCDMSFAESGYEAMTMFEESSFDIVISDMRMPGMDGAQLLALIQEKYPRTIRIMLSGQADDEAILRTVGVVHQFLGKPCDPERLKGVIIKAIALQDLLDNEELKSLISQIGSLPSIPTVYSKLQQAICNPEVSIDDVAVIIEQDIAMSAKVLHIVNSAFFGLYTKIESPGRAVKLLGLDTVKGLVLGVEVFTLMNIPQDLFSSEQLWHHCMAVGALAKKVASHETEDLEIINNAFLAGLLHDIGKLVLVSLLPDQYREIKQIALSENIPLQDAEFRVFKGTHSAVGAYMIGLWGFTSPVMEAIGFHHRISEYPAKVFSPAHAVHIANVIYYLNRPDENHGEKMEIDKSVFAQFGDKDKTEEWLALCSEYFD